MASEMMRPQAGQQRSSLALAQPSASAAMLGMRQTKVATGAVISSPAMEQLKRTAGADLSMHSMLAPLDWQSLLGTNMWKDALHCDLNRQSWGREALHSYIHVLLRCNEMSLAACNHLSTAASAGCCTIDVTVVVLFSN